VIYWGGVPSRPLARGPLASTPTAPAKSEYSDRQGLNQERLAYTPTRPALDLSLGVGVFCPSSDAGPGRLTGGGRSKVGNPDQADCARRAVTARKGQQGKAN